jgi:hypothetical protein
VSAEARALAHGWRDRGKHDISVPGYGHTEVTVFSKGGCRVCIAQEHRGGKLRWHLSISRDDRYPGWEEIKDARYALLPLDLTFAMLLPPPSDYVNAHPNCFHLWECDL